MTELNISTAIEYFDLNRHNNIPGEIKVMWLSELDSKISTDILEPRGSAEFEGYSADGDSEHPLLLPVSYLDLYHAYLNMKLDYLNCEIDRYNNSNAYFNELYNDMKRRFFREKKVLVNKKIKAGN